MKVMGEDLEEKISRTLFLNEFLVGECPRCGSINTHDCEAEHEEINPYNPRETIKSGSSCGVALEVDDITVGHCDDCDYLWCLECGSELTLDSPVCVHWEICEECGKTEEYPDDCPFKDEIESGELLVNPCIPDPESNPERVKQSLSSMIEDENILRQYFDLIDNGILTEECPKIKSCSHCPYLAMVYLCPTIQRYMS
jgi:hypothetical protein